mmetsp:Transcript_16373/g.33366  ORF Transcript_16373/g.33366 Transcript_16373/m.33366 type:complete len:146 (-) Transcript_16373:112-549(-)
MNRIENKAVGIGSDSRRFYIQNLEISYCTNALRILTVETRATKLNAKTRSRKIDLAGDEVVAENAAFRKEPTSTPKLDCLEQIAFPAIKQPANMARQERSSEDSCLSIKSEAMVNFSCTESLWQSRISNSTRIGDSKLRRTFLSF